MEIKGTLKFISEEEQIKADFRKVTVVVEEEGQYPNSMAIEVINDKIDQLDHLAEGSQVVVAYNSKVNEYNGRKFNSIRAWRITDPNANQRRQEPKQKPKQEEPEQIQPAGADMDDLPF